MLASHQNLLNFKELSRTPNPCLADVSDIFYFFLFGEGEGGVRGRRGGEGGRFLLKIPGGGVSRRGAEWPGGCLRQLGIFGGGGGLNIFFRGRIVHQAWYFLKSIAGTNWRRTAVQIGGVLQYKLEVHCGVSLSPKLRSQQGIALQMGGVLRYKL